MLGPGRSTSAETSMRRRVGGFQWWKASLGRGEFVEQRQSRHEPAKRRGAAGEPVAALAEAIAEHERLVGDLVAATAAQRAVLQELYQSAGLEERMGEFPLAPTAPGGAADRSVEVRADLEARLLGPFEVRYRGRALAPWPSQRAASLLKFLLLHRGRLVRREVLMDAFWPSSSPKSARNNLNVERVPAPRAAPGTRSRPNTHRVQRRVVSHRSGALLPDRRR